MKRLFAFVFVIACGGNVDVHPDFDASGNPVGDAGPVLEPDATLPGITRNGWTWTKGPQGADLYGVWGSSASDVWFVGAAGTIMHFDGHAFTASDSGSSAELRGVWGSAANDVWAVGRPYWAAGDAEILHFDGSAWSVSQKIPTSELYAVWGSAANDVWAVGVKGLTAHFDGKTWTTIPSSTQNDLNGVWVAPDHSAWAVGTSAPFGTSSTIIRWTGTSWVTMPSPDNQRGEFAHVWGTSASDVWLAGQAQLDTTAPGLDPSGYLVHWNGSSWDAPFVDKTFSTPLRAVFGSSASQVVAVGSANAALAWNGLTWTASNLPGDFESTWGSAPNDIWAVGLGGVIAHFDGAWTELSPPPPARGVYTAAAIWSNGPNDAWIAGNGAVSTELLHWDGHAWNPSSIAATSPAWLYVYALWGTSASNMWATGTGPKSQSGRIAHFDGTTWKTMFDQDGNYEFLGAWGASDSDVWFAGGNGSLVHWDGANMTPMPLSTQDSLFAVRGSSATDVWLAGNTNEDLTVRHWNGSAWSVAYTGSGFITSLYVASPSDVWGVGWEGSAVHYDGSTWTSMTLPRDVGSIWGSSASDIWAVGYFGAVLHYDGAAWSFVPITEESFAGVSGSGALDVWMVTEHGAILHHP